MRHIYFLNFIVVLFSAQLFAQSNTPDVLLQASALRQRGAYQQVVALLEPLTRQSSSLLPTDRGNAWVLLGSTYQDLGQYPEAEKAYQNAISILKAQPGSENYEAAALDDLGSLYRDMEQPEMSKKLRLRALQIFRSEGDHAGIARVYDNLSVLALQQQKFREAQTYLDQAFAEVKLSPQTNSADLAAMYGNAGILAFQNHDYHQALQEYDLALQLWLQLHGENHELTGWGYVLRSRAHLALGDTQPALQDAQTGIAIIEKTVGKKVAMYCSARLVFADALKAAGSSQQAKAVRNEALHSLESLHRAQSSEVVVNAEAFR